MEKRKNHIKNVLLVGKGLGLKSFLRFIISKLFNRYGGTHKERFDSSGKGRGKVGAGRLENQN